MLTKRQREILDYIRSKTDDAGYMPSLREIARALGVSSPATVHEHVAILKSKGFFKNDWSRAITLPLMGLITAGEPIEAIEEKETIAVPAKLVVDGMNSYVLKVKGRSMIEDGILDGDFVVVERNPSPRNGEVVVALLDNMYATLKRFYRDGARIRLQPANRALKPIFVQPNDLVVQGVVRAVIRQFA